MATNSKLSAALRGNKNASGPHKKIAGTAAKVGSTIGGAVESVKFQAKGAAIGARAGLAVGNTENKVKGVFKSRSLLDKGTTVAKRTIQGASAGRKVGAVAAKVSPMGEARGHMTGREVGTKVDRAVEASSIKINKGVTAVKSTVESIKKKAKNRIKKFASTV